MIKFILTCRACGRKYDAETAERRIIYEHEEAQCPHCLAFMPYYCDGCTWIGANDWLRELWKNTNPAIELGV